MKHHSSVVKMGTVARARWVFRELTFTKNAGVYTINDSYNITYGSAVPEAENRSEDKRTIDTRHIALWGKVLDVFYENMENNHGHICTYIMPTIFVGNIICTSVLRIEAIMVR